LSAVKFQNVPVSGKEFLETGKQRLVGNTKRQATSDDVVELRRENEQLKQLVA
jgi:transposase